jgi:hypothetical protein
MLILRVKKINIDLAPLIEILTLNLKKLDSFKEPTNNQNSGVDINLEIKKKNMPNLNNDQKAEMYNKLLFQFQRLQEQVRLIKAENVEISQQDQQKINLLEKQMRQLYNQTQRLF